MFADDATLKEFLFSADKEDFSQLVESVHFLIQSHKICVNAVIKLKRVIAAIAQMSGTLMI